MRFLRLCRLTFFIFLFFPQGMFSVSLSDFSGHGPVF